jgi:histone deacetylase 6
LAGGEPGSDRHRQQLVELLQAAMAEQERLGSANAVLQRQLAIYFSLRHSDEDAKDGGAGGAGGGAGSKNAAAAAFAAADKDRRYREQLDGVAADRERLATLLSQSEQEATELQSRVEEKEGRCGQLLRAFGDFKHQIAAAAVNSHTGRHIPPEELARYESMERDRDAEVSKVQLRHLHLSSQVAKLTDQLKRRDRVADGLAMMDFEQLKIENSTLSERIEDRSEELAKLKKKATVAVQILTHVREKLHFVQAEAARLTAELQVVEDEVTDQRAVLASAKHERDRFRGEMERAAHAQGFAHNDRLAIDFERRKRDIVALRDRLEATRDRWQRLADVAADRSALLETVMAGGGGTYGAGGGFGASVGPGSFGGAAAGPTAHGAASGTAAGGFGRSTMGGTGAAAMGATGKTGAGSASLGYGRPPVGGASAPGRR